MCAIYAWKVSKYQIPSFLAFAWPALFLSLGWNFLEFGLNPPGPESGLVWGWLICAIVFGLMGGLPLLATIKPVFKRFAGGDLRRGVEHEVLCRPGARGSTSALHEKRRRRRRSRDRAGALECLARIGSSRRRRIRGRQEKDPESGSSGRSARASRGSGIVNSGSSWYWFVIQVLAIVAGTYLGLTFFRIISS